MRTTLPPVLVALSFLLPGTATALPPLFQASAGDESRPADPGLLRVRIAPIDPAAIGSAGRLRLNLFTDVDLVAVRARVVRRGEGDFAWIGAVENVPMSAVVLTVSGNRLAGSILLPARPAYHLAPAGDGLVEIRESDPAVAGGCAVGSAEAEPLQAAVRQAAEAGSRSAAPPSETAWADDDGSVLDLLAVYTPQAAAASPDVALEIQNAVDAVNLAYYDSGIALNLRLVAALPTPSGDSGSLSTDLDRLVTAGDGYHDTVAALRDAHCADLVTLVTETGTGGCGLAFLQETIVPSFETYALSVVKRSCLPGGVVLGHELGHNMAARHDWADDPADAGPFTYNHGHVCTCNAWHDIMAVGNAACGYCGPIPQFANPGISYGGLPTGVPEGSYHAADLKKTFDGVRVAMSNYRTSAACRTLDLSIAVVVFDDAPEGNGDDFPDPGELVTFRVYLEDNEQFTLTGVTGTLSSDDDGIGLFDASASWPSIATGALVSSTSPHFLVGIQSWAAPAGVVPFTLTVTCDQGTFTGTFDVAIGTHPHCDPLVLGSGPVVADASVCADSGVSASWGAADFGSVPIGYVLRRYTAAGCGGAATDVYSGLATSAVDANAPNATNFWYRLTAMSDCGGVAQSACVGPARDDATNLNASAVISPGVVFQGTPQSFTSVVSGGQAPYTFVWDFTNDGTTDAAAQNTTFTYPVAAFHNWRFRVTDAAGCFREITGQAAVKTVTSPTCITDVSNQPGIEAEVKADGGRVVWSQRISGTNYEIESWDGSSVRPITANGLVNRYLTFADGRFAWESYDGSNSNTLEIWTSDGTTTTRLTNDSTMDTQPATHGGQVAWTGKVGSNYAVKLWNGSSTITFDQDPFGQQALSMRDGKVSWLRSTSGSFQIYYWNGTAVQKLTNTSNYKSGTSTYGGRVIWSEQVAVAYQVFLWNGTSIQQLTTSPGDKFGAELTGTNLAFWRGFDGNDWEIYRWDGASVTALTNDTQDDGSYAGSHQLDADGDTAVFTHFDGNDTEIWYWDGTAVRALTNNIQNDATVAVSGRQVTWIGVSGVPANSSDTFYWQEEPLDVTNLKLPAGKTSLTWSSVSCPASPSYRVIRGDVANLSISGGNVNLGPVSCLSPGVAGNSLAISGTPGPGQTWFYLVKEGGAAHFGKSSLGQPGNPSSGNCP